MMKEAHLHWVVVVYSGIANVNSSQAEELLDLICFHSVVPQHLPRHSSEGPMCVRHQPAAEFFPPRLSWPRVTCKRERKRPSHRSLLENRGTYQGRVRLLQPRPQNQLQSTISCKLVVSASHGQWPILPQSLYDCIFLDVCLAVYYHRRVSGKRDP